MLSSIPKYKKETILAKNKNRLDLKYSSKQKSLIDIFIKIIQKDDT